MFEPWLIGLSAGAAIFGLAVLLWGFIRMERYGDMIARRVKELEDKT